MIYSVYYCADVRTYGYWMKRISVALLIMTVLALLAALTACKPVTLNTPTDLVYEDGVLSWSAVAHADNYKVYVDGVEVAEVEENYYVYQAKGQTAFAVAASSGAKRYATSPVSDTLDYKPSVHNRQTLNAPTVIEVNGDGVLIWSYVVNDTGYRIYLNGSLVATVGNQTQYVITIPDAGSYTVQVQAVGNDAYRDSARSATYRVEVSDGKIKAPAVSVPAVSFDVATHRVTWMAVPHALHYEVWQNNVMVARLSADDAHNREVSGSSYLYYYSPTINVRSTRLSVMAIADGTTYSNSAMSNVLSFPLVSEGVPQNVHAVVVDGAVCITWDKLDSNAGYLVKVEQGNALVGTYPVNTNRIQLSLSDGTYRVSVAGDGDGYLFTPTEYSAQIEASFLSFKMLPLVLDAPDNVFFFDKTLHFNSVANADKYQILLDTPCDDEQGTYTYDFSGEEFEIPAFLYGTVLTAYVRAVGSQGYATGNWSVGACYYPVNDPNDVEYYLSQLDQQEGGTGEERDVVIYPDYSVLPTPAGFDIDRDTLSWGAVLDATAYDLVVDGVSYNLTGTEYTLDLSSAHVCKVRALSVGGYVLDSPYTAELTVAKARINPPDELTVSGRMLSWETVPGAAAYVMQINGAEERIDTNIVDLAKLLPYDGTYTIRVYAESAYHYYSDSLYSRTITFVADYEESGTEHKPYKIEKAADLELLVQYPDAWFVLTADVSVGDITPLFGVKNTFSGTIDGKGYALTDIRVSTVEGGDSNGLFGCLYGAVLKNIRLSFASIAWDTSAPMGLLAGEVVQCTFDHVSVTATATGGKTFGTVGVSTGSTYRQCSFDVCYTQTSPSAYVGGAVGKSREDIFEGCAVTGSLTGGVYMGALAAQISDGTIAGCSVGTATTPFAYHVDTGYAGAVGKGSLDSLDMQSYASFTLAGNCYAGAFGGQVTCATVSGKAVTTCQADAESVYVGGALGYGNVDVAEVRADLRLDGRCNTLYAGGVIGYGQGLCVCKDDCVITLDVDFVATEGRYLGGVVGFGTCLYAGAPTGTVCISDTVIVGRLSGMTATATEEGWAVTPKE